MISNKKLHQIETELFIRGRKLIISTIFFFHSILFCSDKICSAKLYTFSYYEDSKQTRPSVNCI